MNFILHIYDRLSKRSKLLWATFVGFIVLFVTLILNLNYSEDINDFLPLGTSEQEALAEKNKLEKVKYESDQKIVAAEAQAKAIEIQAKAIQNQWGKEYVNLKWIEKWDGKLPVTVAWEDTSFIMMMQ